MSRSMPEVHAAAVPDSLPASSFDTPAATPHRGWRRWLSAPARAPRVQRVFLQPDAVWHRPAGANDAAQVDDWAAWCAAHPRQPVQVVLSSRLTTDLLVPPDLPLRRRAEVTTWARQQWLHYHGAVAQAWPVVAWAQGATALSGLALNALTEPAQAHRVSLQQVRPWWSVVWPALQRLAPAVLPDGTGVLWLLEGREVMRLALREGLPVALMPRWLDEATPAALEGLIAEYDDADQPVCVIGHGLAEPLQQPLRGAKALGRLHGPVPHPRWWGR